jgi:hypothetical protein
MVQYLAPLRQPGRERRILSWYRMAEDVPGLNCSAIFTACFHYLRSFGGWKDHGGGCRLVAGLVELTMALGQCVPKDVIIKLRPIEVLLECVVQYVWDFQRQGLYGGHERCQL